MRNYTEGVTPPGTRDQPIAMKRMGTAAMERSRSSEAAPPLHCPGHLCTCRAMPELSKCTRHLQLLDCAHCHFLSEGWTLPFFRELHS